MKYVAIMAMQWGIAGMPPGVSFPKHLFLAGNQIVPMPIRTKLTACICLLFAGCSQQTPDTTSHLLQGTWYQHEVRTQRYDSTANGYQLAQDSTRLTEGCNRSKRYRFAGGNLFFVTDSCRGNTEQKGTWEFANNRIRAATDTAASVYLINGMLVSLEQERLVLRDTATRHFAACADTLACPRRKDSTVTTISYRRG